MAPASVLSTTTIHQLRRELAVSGACPFQIAALALSREQDLQRRIQQLEAQLLEQQQQQLRRPSPSRVKRADHSKRQQSLVCR